MGSHSHITVHNISRIYCYTRGSRIRYNILKKERNILRSFAKERNVPAFFPVLYKERDDLWALSRSLQKNRTFFTLFFVLLKRTGSKKRMFRSFPFFS